MTSGTENIGDHYEGYESALRLHEMLKKLGRAKELKAQVGEEVYEEAFKRKPCVRTLRYLGEEYCLEADGLDVSDFFVKGELYTSIDFNGATYSIAGYREGKRVIGFAYFEWVKNGDRESSVGSVAFSLSS